MSETLINFFNTIIKINVVRINDFERKNVADVIRKNNLDFACKVQIFELNMFSFDSILQPVDVEIIAQFKIYNENQEIVYEQTIKGEHRRRIGLKVLNRHFGELVDGALKNGIKKLVYCH